jgi:two-component system, LuxR family, response regulator FixJ
MTPDNPTVFVVDDDEQARKSVCALARSMDLQAETFRSAEEFLDNYTEDRPGCLVADLRMLGMSGLELQERLVQRRVFLPVIVLTAYARTATTVRAIKAGAVAVLDKPYADDELRDAVRAALAKEAFDRRERAPRQAIRGRLRQLTPTETTILEMIVEGRPNKAIAKELKLSLRSVASRRRELLAKMQVDSTVELIRLVVEARNID